MYLQVISIFPEIFSAITDYGVVGRTIRQKILSLTVHNPRDYADNKHRTVDDRPFGGGPGMVMTPGPLVKSIKAARALSPDSTKVIYLTPQGRLFNHVAVRQFADLKSLILLSGRYEAVDERVLQHHVDEEWSIGDYVLSGGELAAMVVIDAIARLLPNSLGNDQSVEQDSFAQGLLDHPHYTRPEKFAGEAVPKVLLSGDHKAVTRWRLKQAIGRTWLRRPDLLHKLELTEEQLSLLNEFKNEMNNGLTGD